MSSQGEMKTIALLLGAVLPCATVGFLAPSTHSFRLPETKARISFSRLMAMKEIGVGVIGAGRIGIVHLEALAGW